MDYKEKFEDFLDKMKGLLDNAEKQGHIIIRVEDLENTFPELRESEDEKIRKEIISFIQDHFDEINFQVSGDYDNRDKEDIALQEWCKEAIAWLEKQGNKPAWSEEDEVRLQTCIDCLQAKSLMGKVDTVMTNWLKSLKERVIWKPSDEQMEALNDVISSRDIKYDVLSELWNDLKKLKGE